MDIVYKIIVAAKSTIDFKNAKEKVNLERNNLSKVKKGLKQIKESDGIDKIIDDVVEIPFKEIEILYIPTENDKQRIFVPIENK